MSLKILRLDDIDVDKLIEEVEKRPELYNRELKEYSNNALKMKIWNEIAKKIFSFWDTLTEEQKIEAVKRTQKKWKNVRSCFARELRGQKESISGQSTIKRRKYKYFNQLLFLIPTLDIRSTYGTVGRSSEDENTYPENPAEFCDVEVTQSHTELSESDDERTIKIPIKKMKKIQKNIHTESRKISKLDIFEEKLLEILERTHSYAESSDLETNFALSLIPMLKALSPNKKIDVQIQILQIFKNASNPD